MFKHLITPARNLSFFLIISVLSLLNIGYSQSVVNVAEHNSLEKLENIGVVPLFTDSLASSFLIWIKDEVKAHKHVYHSEHVYVLQGTGIMKLGEQEVTVKQGDIIYIPKNTIHSARVTSEIPMKVISIQAPFFEGIDRVFIDSKK